MSQISAKVIAHSKSATDGKEIVTFELTYHRYIHAEFLTHRLLSRNSMSSRAVPVAKMLDQVRNDPATPVHWGKNQAGMQAGEECKNKVTFGMFQPNIDDPDMHEHVSVSMSPKTAWRHVATMVADSTEAFSNAGYHKQLCNRLQEPFQLMKTVVTATEWDNFFWLRRHKDAQPEIKELADKMWLALQASEPVVLEVGDWHLPYIRVWKPFDGPLGYLVEVAEEVWMNTKDESYRVIVSKGRDNFYGKKVTLEEAQKISASCCAQVSYRNTDTSLEKAHKIYEALVGSSPVHGSPMEHQATPMEVTCYNPALGIKGWEVGVTGCNRSGKLLSGNFQGWVQYRQLLEDNACWEYSEDAS